MNSHARLLPELELEVMKVLWRRESATVAEVQDELKPARPLAYTTVMTVLDRLARKGAVHRHKQGRGYLYRPSVSEQAVCELAFERLLSDFFSRSPQKLLEYVQERRLDAQAYNGNGSPQLDSALL
jgi:BlaI family transcriptional regulator, penicillinase repressor